MLRRTDDEGRLEENRGGENECCETERATSRWIGDGCFERGHHSPSKAFLRGVMHEYDDQYAKRDEALNPLRPFV